MSDVKPLNHVLIFTKYPTAGYAKTRLIPAVGAERAAEISRKLSRRVVHTARNFLSYSTHPAVLRIYLACSTQHRAELSGKWLDQPDAGFISRESLHKQADGNLGQKLSAAFAASFEDGAGKALVIGADIPEIDGELLAEAFRRLEDADLVVGPAADGGYYLLAMKRLYIRLFENIPWSTEMVYTTTITKAEEIGLSVFRLRTLRDVDLPEDLSYFEDVVENTRNRGQSATERTP